MRTINEIFQGMNPVEFVFRCRIDFKFFCEKVLGLTEYGGIHPYQLEWFYLIQNNDRIIIEAPSGYSKTTIVGVAYPLWVIFNNKNKKILLLSKTLPQVKDAMLTQIRNYIEDNELLKELIPKDAKSSWNQSQLNMSNGCLVVMRPYSVNVKSTRADYILMDEIDSYEDTNIYFDYVISRLNPGGKIVGISTPENEGRLIGLIRARQLKDYIIRKYTAIVNPKVPGDLSTGESIWAEKFPMDYLMKLRAEQGEQFFQKNYMCNVKIGSEDSIFKLNYIFNCFDTQRDFRSSKESEDSFVILGADFAIASGPKSDFDAYVIIEKRDDFYIIKHIEIWKGIPTPSKVTRIQELIEEYKVDLVAADESNVGHEAVEQLLNKGITVIPYKFSGGDYGERKKTLVVLKNIIESGKLVIPRHPYNSHALEITNKFVTQLTGFVEETSEKTKHKLLISNAIHDDIVMACGMAVREGTKQITGSFF